MKRLLDRMDRIEKNFDSIYVREMINGEFKSVPLSEASSRAAMQWIFKWLREVIPESGIKVMEIPDKKSIHLPEYLEFVQDEHGVKVFGMGPYTCYIRDLRDLKIHRITIPYPPQDTTNLPQFFVEQFKLALKEALNEDLECGQPNLEHDSDVRKEDPV